MHLKLYTTSPNFTALLTRNSETIKNKTTDSEPLNSHDCSALLGNLYLIAKHNKDFYDETINLEQVLDDASFCDRKLYLNNFEGYRLDDRLTLHFLFLNKYNQTIGGVVDNLRNKYLYFIFD